MTRNIEIKARASDFDRQTRLAEGLGTGGGEHLVQEDTFFDVPRGRLELRTFENGLGELIQYHRADTTDPTESRYVLAPTNEPEALKEALSNALGVRAVVRKQRVVHMVGRTRIHLDRVEDLGEFIELEVVLEPEEPARNGIRVAEELMTTLEIRRTDLVEWRRRGCRGEASRSCLSDIHPARSVRSIDTSFPRR